MQLKNSIILPQFQFIENNFEKLWKKYTMVVLEKEIETNRCDCAWKHHIKIIVSLARKLSRKFDVIVITKVDTNQDCLLSNFYSMFCRRSHNSWVRNSRTRSKTQLIAKTCVWNELPCLSKHHFSGNRHVPVHYLPTVHISPHKKCKQCSIIGFMCPSYIPRMLFIRSYWNL